MHGRNDEGERGIAIYIQLYSVWGGDKRLMDGWVDVDKRAEGVDGYSLKRRGEDDVDGP